VVTLTPLDADPEDDPWVLVRVVTGPPDGPELLAVEPELLCDWLVRVVTGAPATAEPPEVEAEVKRAALVRVCT
jgi:hypothetical protein